MRRNIYQIVWFERNTQLMMSTGQGTTTKYAWNAALRECQHIVSTRARFHGTYFRSDGEYLEKDARGRHAHGVLIWSDAYNHQIRLEITRITVEIAKAEGR